MTDDLAAIRAGLADVRVIVAAIGARHDAKLDAHGAEISRIGGRIEAIFATMTAGQEAQDTRIANLAVEQGERRGASDSSRRWMSALQTGLSAVAGFVGGIISAHIGAPHS